MCRKMRLKSQSCWAQSAKTEMKVLVKATTVPTNLPSVSCSFHHVVQPEICAKSQVFIKPSIPLWLCAESPNRNWKKKTWPPAVLPGVDRGYTCTGWLGAGRLSVMLMFALLALHFHRGINKLAKVQTTTGSSSPSHKWCMGLTLCTLDSWDRCLEVVFIQLNFSLQY